MAWLLVGSQFWNPLKKTDQGNAGWGTVNIAATPTYDGVQASPNQRFYQLVRVRH